MLLHALLVVVTAALPAPPASAAPTPAQAPCLALHALRTYVPDGLRSDFRVFTDARPDGSAVDGFVSISPVLRTADFDLTQAYVGPAFGPSRKGTFLVYLPVVVAKRAELKEWTRAQLGHSAALFHRATLLAAPRVVSTTDGPIPIEGSWSEPAAKAVLDRLRSDCR